MQVKRGSGLVELLISMTLFLFLVIVTTKFIFSLYKNGTQLQASLADSQDLFAAVNVLERDIHCASHLLNLWELALPNPIWLVGQSHIQWYTKSDRLIRRTGIYCKKKQKWKKHSDSLIARNVNVFILKPNQNKKQNITTVSYNISMKTSELSGLIPLKNRDIT